MASLKRRQFLKAAGALMASHALSSAMKTAPVHAARTMEEDHVHDSVPGGASQEIAMLLYPGVTALDLVGPHAFFTALGNTRVHLVWKTRDVVVGDNGLAVRPTALLEECPSRLTVLFVPGGLRGTTRLMEDPEILEFLRDRGSQAGYITSVCTGSLLLGAAGLLNGYKATSYWLVRDLLPLFGAEPISARIVEDRNRITGAGVTAGLDFALQLAVRLRDERYAQMLQLGMEYDPHPPFSAGTPEQAGQAMTQHLRSRRAAEVEAARATAQAAARRLQ